MEHPTHVGEIRGVGLGGVGTVKWEEKGTRERERVGWSGIGVCLCVCIFVTAHQYTNTFLIDPPIPTKLMAPEILHTL